MSKKPVYIKNFFLAAVAVAILLLLPQCKKDKLEIIHENKVITGNTSPPYSGVSKVVIENYLNKLYIDLIGREPYNTELEQDVALLMQNELNDASKDLIISRLMNDYNYYRQFDDRNRTKFLEGTDSIEIQFQYNVYLMIQAQHYQQGDTFTAQLFHLPLLKVYNLLHNLRQYSQDSISINIYFSRLIDNIFYDEINMGSENFVKACFENLFGRFPSTAELDAGIKMADGMPGSIFLVDGKNKGDFINIVTNTNEFYQGLVIENYRDLLSRQPTSAEMGTLTQQLKTHKDLKAIQKFILKSKEYAGF